MGAIYKITNKINNKIYIGKTKYNDVLIRFNQHLLSEENLKETDHSYLHKAIKKYGRDNFHIICLEKNITNIEELNNKEIYYINMFDSTNPKIGYNLAKGGDGGNQGNIINQRISKACKGKNNWTKGRITVNNTKEEKKIKKEDLEYYLNLGWIKGRLPVKKETIEKWKHTIRSKTKEEKELSIQKAKIKRSNTIQNRTVEERKLIAEKISKARKNNPKCASLRKGIPAEKWMSPEHLEKLKQAVKKPKSEEHKKHLSESRLKKGLGKGEKNGMFGKGYKISGYNSKIAKKVKCLETGIIYYSTIIASQETGIRAGGIQDAARGVQKTCGGYHWEYVENDKY